MKVIVSVFLIFLLCAGSVAAQDQQAESLRRLTPDIKVYLDRTYPGWAFMPVPAKAISCRDIETRLHPSLARGDFNGDGQADFALQIIRGGRLYAFEFLSRGKTYGMNKLFERKLAPGKDFSAALIVEPKGRKTSVGTIEKVDTLQVNDCESVPMRFEYRNGRVKDVSPPD
jgi:hypothetical protein